MFLSSRMLCVLLAYRIAQVKPDLSGFLGRNLSNIERKCRILSIFLFCPNSRNSQNTRLLRPFPTVLQKKIKLKSRSWSGFLEAPSGCANSGLVRTQLSLKYALADTCCFVRTKCIILVILFVEPI